MPRKSAEQRAAELWRIGYDPPPPPSSLSPPARKLWKEIAASKPADYWTPTLCILLRRFCRTAEFAEVINNRLDDLLPGDPEALALGRQVTAANASLGSLAVRMRLSAQNTITPHSREQINEGGILDHPLIGGHAIRGKPDRPQ